MTIIKDCTFISKSIPRSRKYVALSIKIVGCCCTQHGNHYYTRDISFKEFEEEGRLYRPLFYGRRECLHFVIRLDVNVRQHPVAHDAKCFLNLGKARRSEFPMITLLTTSFDHCVLNDYLHHFNYTRNTFSYQTKCLLLSLPTVSTSE